MTVVGTRESRDGQVNELVDDAAGATLSREKTRPWLPLRPSTASNSSAEIRQLSFKGGALSHPSVHNRRSGRLCGAGDASHHTGQSRASPTPGTRTTKISELTAAPPVKFTFKPVSMISPVPMSSSTHIFTFSIKILIFLGKHRLGVVLTQSSRS